MKMKVNFEEEEEVGVEWYMGLIQNICFIYPG